MTTSTSTVVLFRGRNTDGVLQDAISSGLVPKGARVVIVVRDNDALAQPGDMVVGDVICDLRNGDTRVIANGGTTAQLVPIIAFLAAHAGADDVDSKRTWRWSAWDIQRDGVTQLAGDSISPKE